MQKEISHSGLLEHPRGELQQILRVSPSSIGRTDETLVVVSDELRCFGHSFERIVDSIGAAASLEFTTKHTKAEEQSQLPLDALALRA
jgi:hypothetical protein